MRYRNFLVPGLPKLNPGLELANTFGVKTLSGKQEGVGLLHTEEPQIRTLPNATDDKDPQFQAIPSNTAGFPVDIFVARLKAVERKTTWL